MNQKNMSDNKKQKQSESDRAISKKEESTERELDKELEMTFPASDPLAIIQPAPHKDSADQTATQTNDTKRTHK